jgi:RNA polymerase sigma-70 factor (ECF subfamily)
MPVELSEEVRERARRFELEARPLLDQLYGIAYRLAGQAATAEDLVQEALLRGYQAFDRFQAGTNFRAWIVRILTNIFINAYRRKAYIELSMDPADLPPKSAPSEPDSDESVTLSAEELCKLGDLSKLKDRLGEAIVGALEKVPQDYRIVFLLSCLGEQSYADISKTLEIPMGTVMSRLYRARALLRGELVQYGRSRGLLATQAADVMS